MNVLRELRKFKTKSAMAKIRVLILLAVMLVVSSYAWMTLRKDVEVGNLQGVVESWEVEYSINGEKVEEEVTIAIDEFYPGAYVDEDGDGSDWYTKTIAIKNMAAEPTTLKYEIISVKLFGNEVYAKDGINQIGVDYLNADKKINLFTDKVTYPFYLWCDYTSSWLEGGKFVDEATTPNRIAKFTIKAYWPYDTGAAYNSADTTLGERAFTYYSTPNPDGSEKEHALLITLKISTDRELAE